MAIVHTLSSAQETNEVPSQETVTTSNGVILEFEQNGNNNTKRQETDKKPLSEIEFIIGGQGENGVAKRGQLKVIK